MITSSGSKIGLKQKIIAKLKRAFPNDTFFISSFPNAYTATKLQAALARAQACHEAAKELQEQADGKRGGELGKFKRMAKFVVDVEGHPDAVAQLDEAWDFLDRYEPSNG